MVKFSKYVNHRSQTKTDIDVNEYITIVKAGFNQDLVIQARLEKERGNLKEYKALKEKSSCITGSAVMKDGDKTANNIKELNGLILIDIDEKVPPNVMERLKVDKYAFIVHRSFGGDGACIFVKINEDKFIESFDGLAEYFYRVYSLTADQSCKNKNRLRYVSYDPDLYYNEKSVKFIPKTTKEAKEIKEKDYVSTDADFDYILSQIKEKKIDLCQDDYYKYIRIGYAIFDKFGSDGFTIFDFICSFGPKYDSDKISKHYQNLSKTGSVTISTFFHYCKEAGIEIYTPETKETIKVVKVQKSQGKPTIETVKKQLATSGIVNPDENLISHLIDSKKDYLANVENDESQILQIEKFIMSFYQPETNSLTNETFINTGERLDDKKLNDIYISCKKLFNFNVNKNDVRDILNSNIIPSFDPINKYFKENKEVYTDQIEQYISCIEPYCDYNLWAFKKWLVGCIHNWTADIKEPKVSPLTLVLCGQKQGTGKTSFFRELLPPDLSEYYAETKIDLSNKDSLFNLSKSLIVMDDEFGGIATRDVKDFKKMADTNIIDMRLPYGATYSKFKRRASLSGTSNESNILKDVTGNRRILPIQVHRIDYDRMVSIDKNALWKQVFDLFLNGFDWKIYKDTEVDYLNVNTELNIDVNPVEELFFNHYSLEQTFEFCHRCVTNQGEVYNHLSINTGVKISKFDIKDIFTKNKIEYKNYKVKGMQKKGVLLFQRENSDQIEDADVF